MTVLSLDGTISSSDPRKGIGMPYSPYPEDLERMGASWYYNWSPTIAPNCVPAFRMGDVPGFPLDYSGYVLLFNEPNNPEPYGHPIPPDEAVVIYMQLYDTYPRVVWVVGNVNIFYRHWMIDFWRICKETPGCVMPEYLGFHVYIDNDEDAAHLHLFLDGMHKLEFPNTKWWITEFADVYGGIYNDALILSEFRKRAWIERWAIFCNRAKGDEPWYPAGWNVQLFDWVSDEPTDIGRWYANDVHNIFMPMVQR